MHQLKIGRYNLRSINCCSLDTSTLMGIGRSLCEATTWVSREEGGSAHDLDSYLATSAGRTWTAGGNDKLAGIRVGSCIACLLQ
jgi:hypothetical protein